MAHTIAWQIFNDFESRMDEGEFDTSCEANEWLLEQIQGACIIHTQLDNKDIYKFRDNSAISFKGNEYRVEVAA